jgi:competence protein ComGC
MKHRLNTDFNAEPQKRGWTLIELLALIFIISITAVVYLFIAPKYGVVVGIGTGIVTIVACFFIVIQFYRWRWRKDKQRLQELREKYQAIYHVNALPVDEGNLRKAAGAEIKIGDYGWEAGPLRKDGLIYLQGLTPEWHVVWHAGFRPEQIEKVATKPASQYDYWHPYWAKVPTPPPCPFPILARSTATMGLPHHSHRYFENYPRRTN